MRKEGCRVDRKAQSGSDRSGTRLMRFVVHVNVMLRAYGLPQAINRIQEGSLFK